MRGNFALINLFITRGFSTTRHSHQISPRSNYRFKALIPAAPNIRAITPAKASSRQHS